MLIFEAQPEVSRKIHNLWWVIQEQLLIPMWVSCVFNHNTKDLVELIWLSIFVQRPSEFYKNLTLHEFLPIYPFSLDNFTYQHSMKVIHPM